jgi:alpha/beta superfamily hydrolase
MAGFSFGSWIAARLAVERPDVEQLLLVAPPVRRMSFEILLTGRVPKLVLQGTHDEVCPLDELQEQFPAWAEPKRLVVVPEATHFFDRRLGELGRAIDDSLRPEAMDPRAPGR